MDRSAEVEAVVAALAVRHPRFPPATIERLVTRTFEDFRDAAIQAFVPILVLRRVQASLRYADGDPTALPGAQSSGAQAASPGRPPTGQPKTRSA